MNDRPETAGGPPETPGVPSVATGGPPEAPGVPAGMAGGPPDTAGTAYQRAPVEPERRHPSAAWSRELTKFREYELVTLRHKLARIPERPRARAWATMSGVLFGAALGGLFGGIPLLNSRSDWDSWIVPVYGASIAVGLLVSGICFFAARGMREERGVTLQEVKSDLDEILGMYGIEVSDPVDRAGASRFRRLISRLAPSRGR
jgi:hypothetical protein